MEIFTPDPQKGLSAAVRGPSYVPRLDPADNPFDVSKDYGFGDAFSAAFRRESEIVSVVHELSDGDTATADEIRYAPKHNPYRYILENYDKDVQQRLASALDDGEFEGSLTPRQTKAIVNDVLLEMELQDKMAASPGGAFLGAIAAGVVNPTSYIPIIGQAARVGRVGKMGIIALNTALSTGVSETVLQMTQRERSMEETLMNIGISSVLGGGIGIFAHAVDPKHPLHPRNPDNPLLRENLDKQGETFRDYSGRTDELTSEELATLRSDYDRSVGAASSIPESVIIARRDPAGVVSKIVRKVGDVFNSRSIVGRVLRDPSSVVRAIGVSLMDPGGTILKSYLSGKAAAKSAEIVKADYMTATDQLYASLFASTAHLNRTLGLKLTSKIDHTDVMLATQRTLYRMDDPELDASLTKKYGAPAVGEIKKVAQKNAEEIHALNDVWEKRLVKEGLVRDEGLVASLHAEVQSLKEQIKAHEHAPGAVGPKKADVDASKDELMRLREKRDLRAAALADELAKPKAMGRDYGHAQLWNKEAILRDPSAFKLFLMDALAIKPDDEWLITNYGITLEQLQTLQKFDLPQYRKILQDWYGDAHYFQIERLEESLASAEARLKDANLDLQETARAAGMAHREEDALTISEARKRRDALAADLNEKRARRAQLLTEQRTLKEAATAARGATLDRAMTERVEISGTPSVDLHDALRGFARSQDDTGEKSVATARAEGSAEAIGSTLEWHDKQVRIGEERLANMDTKLREVEGLRSETTHIRRKLDEAVSEARIARNIEETSVSKVKRSLLKAKKSTPLDDMVDDVFANLTRTGSLDGGIIDRVRTESDRVSGRVKERILQLTPEQRIEGVQKGYLQDDLAKILYQQYDQLASELAIRESVGIGPSRRFASWSEVVESIRSDYNRMVSDAAQAGDKKTADWLSNRRDKAVSDIVEARDRIKGTHHDDGADGWLNWGSAKIRGLNFIRYGSGFLFSSLTDTATVALRHGGLTKLLGRYAPQAIHEMRAAWKADPTEFQSFVSAMEVGMGAAASARRYGADDLIHGAYANYGIGYGRTRQFTGFVDRGFDKMSHVVSVFSGLPAWNRFWKTVSGLAMKDKLADAVRRYDALPVAQVADLASLGIGRAEASRMAKFIEKYGATSDGHWDPHFEKWGDSEEALAAQRDFRMAIMRDMNRAINTPGVGDTPRLMSKWWGRLWLQFQTFAFTFLNRFAYPMVQRASLFRERQAFQAMAMLIPASAMVLMARDVINGRDPMDRLKPENLTTTLHEIIDRSGLLGWTSPYADSFLKLTSPITGYASTNRYARNSWLDSLRGAGLSILDSVQGAGTAVASGSPDAWNKLLALMPFNTQVRLFGNQLLPQLQQ